MGKHDHPDEPFLTQHGQAALLEEALSDLGRRGSTDVAPRTSVDAAAALTPNIKAELVDRVGRMQNTVGKSGCRTETETPLTDRLEKARQRVNWVHRTMEWVIFEDVLEEVQLQGDRSYAARKRAMGDRMFHFGGLRGGRRSPNEGGCVRGLGPARLRSSMLRAVVGARSQPRALDGTSVSSG